jgi:hypothetical protein
MTDRPDPLDELASAHLDGATTPDEAARIAGDPALRARVEELRAARDALRAAVTPVDPVQRDAAISAAVTAFHDEGATAPAAAAGPVTSLAQVAARRRRSSGLVLRVVGAAAVLVLLALLVPLLADRGADDAETADRATGAAEDDALTESAGEDADTAAGNATDNAPAEGQAGGDGAPTTSFSERATRLGDLGSFDDVDALAAALTGDDAAALFSREPLGAAGVGCAEERADAAAAGTVIAADASVAGEPVEVVVVTRENGARSMTVLRAGSCTVLATRVL